MIKKIKQLSIYATINGAFLYCVWQGAVNGNNHLMSVVIGYSVILFILSALTLVCCSNNDFYSKLKKIRQKHIVNRFIDAAYDIVITSIMFYSENIFIGILYLLHFVIMYGIKDSLENDTTTKL